MSNLEMYRVIEIILNLHSQGYEKELIKWLRSWKNN